MTKRLFTVAISALVTSIVFLSSLSPVYAKNPGYWTTKSGEIIRNGFDQCWRTRYWTPEHAIAECEGIVDSDGDGIADDVDACPNTAVNIEVDSKGCELDSDGDGVVNSLDKCPQTAAGEKVDASGCKLAPLDSDGDGIVDSQDRCPDTPQGVTVDAIGCELDDDGDGIANSLDKCPTTKAGVQVNAMGCEPDGDSDGITDANDNCPNTAAGEKVDARGCKLEANIVLQGVNFETGSDDLTNASFATLNEVASTLKRYPDIKVEVAGYTDNTGSVRLNQALSQKRAQAVADYLISQGVLASNVTAKGYGPESPVADNNTAAGRAENRRVELNILE